jgi:Reverse transcriptase (RNA-dependent DNA polymerase)
MKEQHALIALYVDDLLIACFNKKMCRDLEKEFCAEFSMKIMGSVNHILGIDVRNSVENHTVHSSQTQYIFLIHIITFNNMGYTVMVHQWI